MQGIYRDRRRRLRASSEAFPALLAGFLETDVADRLDRCEALLEGLDRARRGEPFVAAGSGYALSADLEMVVIRDGHDNVREPLRLSLADVERALMAWRRAIG